MSAVATARMLPVVNVDASPVPKGRNSDACVEVADELSCKTPAYDYAGSINNHPQLTEMDKQSLLWVLAQSPCFHRLIQLSDIGGHGMPDWVKCTGMLGIQISRQDPVPPERVYKMRGIAEIPASTEVGNSHTLLQPAVAGLSLAVSA